MRKAYLLRQLPSGAVQIWRNMNGWTKSSDTGYVFYNCNYSTAAGIVGGAAFIRAAAYRFELPSKYVPAGAEVSVDSFKITTKHHGVALFSGSCLTKQTISTRMPVFALDASTSLLPSDSPWRRNYSVFKFGAFAETALTSKDAC